MPVNPKKAAITAAKTQLPARFNIRIKSPRGAGILKQVIHSKGRVGYPKIDCLSLQA
jgi:hypothetical protein